jgi:hypothetical protein
MEVWMDEEATGFERICCYVLELLNGVRSFVSSGVAKDGEGKGRKQPGASRDSGGSCQVDGMALGRDRLGTTTSMTGHRIEEGVYSAAEAKTQGRRAEEHCAWGLIPITGKVHTVRSRKTGRREQRFTAFHLLRKATS